VRTSQSSRRCDAMRWIWLVFNNIAPSWPAHNPLFQSHSRSRAVAAYLALHLPLNSAYNETWMARDSQITVTPTRLDVHTVSDKAVMHTVSARLMLSVPRSSPHGSATSNTILQQHANFVNAQHHHRADCAALLPRACPKVEADATLSRMGDRPLYQCTR
jgi:hypothetical protein